jgi:hypothetical protein
LEKVGGVFEATIWEAQLLQAIGSVHFATMEESVGDTSAGARLPLLASVSARSACAS